MTKGKSLPWFCFHTDWRINPKVRQLPDAIQLRHIEIMCLKREGFYPCTDAELSWHLRCTEQEASAVCKKLADAGLLEEDGDIHDWDKRQRSDYTSTDRVRKHREKQVKRSGNVPMKQNGTTYSTVHNSTEQNTKKKGAGKPALRPHLKDSQEVLNHLNSKMGKSYTVTTHIEACFKREGCTVAQCKSIINFKSGQWKGTDMEKNMNPKTPWRAIHFKDYLDEAGAQAAPAADNRKRDEWGRVIPQWELDLMKEDGDE